MLENIPAKAGIGLRHQHYKTVLADKPDVAWFEVHSENYFSDGGLPHFYLEQIAKSYPLSFHGVGLSIGSAEPLDTKHLQKLKALFDRYQPRLVSEHLSFSKVGNRHFNDLLPLPYTEASLQNFCDHVSQVQDTLGRQILIENPSSYIGFTASTISEWDFFGAIPARTGCGLLVDLNNIHVSCVNHNYDSAAYFEAIAGEDIQEYHLAGYTRKQFPEGDLLIDDHGSKVHHPVWTLFETAMKQWGTRPTLIEWDSNVPDFEVLLEERDKAQIILDSVQ